MLAIIKRIALTVIILALLPSAATGTLSVYATENSWVTKAPMHQIRAGLGAVAVNGKIYLIGGIETDRPDNAASPLSWGKRVSNAVEVYDPANDSWTTKTSMPTAVGSYVSAVFGNRIYVITSGLTQIYDVEHDSWSFGAPSTSFVYCSGGATTGMFAPQRIYMFTAQRIQTNYSFSQGFPITNSYIASDFKVQCYDPQANNWTITNASMPTWRYGTAVATANDKLYVIGGYTLNPTTTFTALNEQYTPFGYVTIPPKISIVSPQNTNYTTSNVALTFTLNKPASWMGYSLDKEETVTITGNLTIIDLPSGLHNVTVYANGTFGTFGRSETISFTVAEEAEPFPTALVAAASAVLAVAFCAGLLIYFRKHRR